MSDPSFSDSSERSVDSDPGFASLVGQVVSGRYRVEAELGTGGMGAVYRAEHTLMRKRLAIKVLHPEMTRQPEVVARFEREAMAAAHIEHPNVAAATDFGKLEDGSFFLVLEYVEGRSLREVLDAEQLGPSRVLHIGKQITSALVRAHSLGIVHRDLKPENVMLVKRDDDPDFVKVLDFGIAKVPVAEITKETGRPHKALTQAGMVYGTPEYMAPEQALGREVDARADLYALGVMFYEMLSGRRPFEADNPVTLLGMQVTQCPPPFAKTAPTRPIPTELEALVMELLEKEAERRPTDARQVLDAIEQTRLTLADPNSWPSQASVQAVGAADTVFRLGPETNSGRVVIRLRQQSEGLVVLAERVSRGLESAQRLIRFSYVSEQASILR
ncbi:MAG: serine/threonine protein kinase, partial [Polyangiaceae bacterium]|nr:serine/threonine protein kinase [Polyangiaceae bacterium]